MPRLATGRTVRPSSCEYLVLCQLPGRVIQARKSSVVELNGSPTVADHLHSWTLNLHSKPRQVNELRRWWQTFFLGLEMNLELKSSAMSGQFVRPRRAVGNRRMLTTGVDCGGAASVSFVCLFQDCPLDPNCLYCVNINYWTASGQQVKNLGLQNSWGPSKELARDSEHLQLD